MKKAAFIFITFFVCFNGFTQIKKANELKTRASIKKRKNEIPPPPSPYDVKYIKPHKINFTKYNLTKRLSFYPFNKASKIEIVSFSLNYVKKDWLAYYDQRAVLIEGDTINREKYIQNGQPFVLPMKNDSILFDKMNQIKILTLSEEIEISDILYNSCYRWSDWEDKVLGCYFPRNAIIFFDENDKPFGYLEICFECRAIEKSSQNIKLIENCDYLYEELEKYFNKLGIITKPKIEE